MNRRQFLTASLAAPAVLGLTGLPARAGSTGSTLLEAPGLTASGAFDIRGYVPGTDGEVNMQFTNGPRVASRFRPSAIERVIGAAAGDTFSVVYIGFNQADTIATTWELDSVASAGAQGRFTTDGGLTARASAIVGGDQYDGAGVAAMILAAMSAGSILRGATTNRLQALVRPRQVPGAFAFGLEVTVRNA